MTGVASAQTAALNTNSAATMHRDGEWRASKLVGVNVYNEANEKVDDINEIILDKSGHVANVILGIGGFLGMGEHYVTVAFDKLKWVNEGVQTTTATTTDGTAPMLTTPAAPTPEPQQPPPLEAQTKSGF